MPKFIMEATMFTFLKLEIEAENEEEAYLIGKKTDGGDFIEVGSDWEYGDTYLTASPNTDLKLSENTLRKERNYRWIP
jgi:hypothetical protein